MEKAEEGATEKDECGAREAFKRGRQQGLIPSKEQLSESQQHSFLVAEYSLVGISKDR